jgi:hypothetical protein
LREIGLPISGAGHLWESFQCGLKRADELILVSAYFSKERWNYPLLLFQNGPYKMLGLYLLMPESFGQLLSGLYDFLCL